MTESLIPMYRLYRSFRKLNPDCARYWCKYFMTESLIPMYRLYRSFRKLNPDCAHYWCKYFMTESLIPMYRLYRSFRKSNPDSCAPHVMDCEDLLGVGVDYVRVELNRTELSYWVELKMVYWWPVFSSGSFG